MFIELVLLLLASFLFWLIRDRSKYHGYPPGPFRFPLLGNLPQLALKSRVPSTALRQISDQYGEVSFVQMGSIDFVVISSYSAVMELFSLEGVSCNRKMFKYIVERNCGGNVGLVTSNGTTWQTLRRFTIRTLREFGFGKSASMDTVINEEANKFVSHFQSIVNTKSVSGVLQIDPHLFDASVLNILWRLVTGQSHQLNDPRIIEMLELSDAYLRSARVDDISVCYPILRDWFPNWTGKTIQLECTENLKKFLDGVIQEHHQRDYAGNPQCFIDVFLKNIDNVHPGSDFTHNQLLYTVLDLFFAGSETTSKTLNFVLIYMVLYPEKQDRVRNEVDAALKEGHVITSNDMKEKLPYTYAVIAETMRLNDVVPIPAPFECYKDLSFRGYRIPKGTPIITNLEAVHYQKSIWGDPDTFRPERFVDSISGKLKHDLLEHVMPFSKGKRQCPGQTLAETTLLLYFTKIIKNFKLEKLKGDKGPSTEPTVGLTYSSKPYKIEVISM